MKNKYVRPLTEALEVCALEFLAASPSQLRVNQRTTVHETLEEEEIIEEKTLAGYAKSVNVWDDSFDYSEWM